MLRTAIAASADQSVSLVLEQMPLLLPDQPEQTRKLIFELLLPQPGGYFEDAIDVPYVTDVGISAAYILGENDLVLARPGTEFAARIGLTPVTAPGGHDSMLTHPDEAAAAIPDA